jgi:hypothetical protein
MQGTIPKALKANVVRQPKNAPANAATGALSKSAAVDELPIVFFAIRQALCLRP